MTSRDSSVPAIAATIETLPVSALQAIYHAVTGKTENLSKTFRNDYIIRKDDLDQLNLKIQQQLEHYDLAASPTVTIKVKLDNDESLQFSSWERFSLFDQSKTEIVSEIVIKFEFLIKLPTHEKTQRYILNIDLDSKLPIAAKQDLKLGDMWFPWALIRQLPSISISIDYVDYVFAKNFVNTLEDWVSKLDVGTTSKFILKLERMSFSWGYLFRQIGILGGAFFASTVVWLQEAKSLNLNEVVYLMSLSVVFGVLTSIVGSRLGGSFDNLVRRGIVPSCIVLTKGDERAFEGIQANASSALPGLAMRVGGLFFAFGLNILASFVYDRIKF